MILHVMHSSGAARRCVALSVGGVVGVVEAMGEVVVLQWSVIGREAGGGKGDGTDSDSGRLPGLSQFQPL